MTIIDTPTQTTAAPDPAAAGDALAGAQGEGARARAHVELTDDQAQWRQAYLAAAAQEKHWADIKTRAREHLEHALGDAEEGKVGDRVLVRWSYVETTRLQTSKLKANEPEVYERYLAPSVSRRFTVPEDEK